MQDLKQEMNQLKMDLGIVKKAYCNQEEQEIFKRMEKEGKRISGEKYGEVFADGENNTYYRNVEEDLPKEKIEELIAYQQISSLKSIKNLLETIKNCAIFFVVLSIISILMWFLIMIRVIA